MTRDRIYGESDWNGRKFTLVDTGGIEPNTDNQILAFMRQQAQIAIDNATVIVLVVDIKTGMTAADQEVAGMLQRSKKPIVLAVNKMDSTGTVDRNFMSFTIWVWAIHRRFCRPWTRHWRPAGRMPEIFPSGG